MPTKTCFGYKNGRRNSIKNPMGKDTWVDLQWLLGGAELECDEETLEPTSHED